jgi:hypothetical protein
VRLILTRATLARFAGDADYESSADTARLRL